MSEVLPDRRAASYGVPLLPLPPGTSLVRYLRCLVVGRGDVLHARELAAGMRDTPLVHAELDALITKAPVEPGNTTDPEWAGHLITPGLASEAITALKGLSAVAQLQPRLRRVPFGVKVPREIAPVALGDWVLEGQPTAAAELAFDAVPALAAMKIAVIIALNEELILAVTRASEQVVRQAVLGGLAKTIDMKFLSPAAPAAGHPPSITYGAIEHVSTGSTAAAIAADLSAMIGSITTAGGALTWVMKPTTAAHIAGAIAQSGLPQTLFSLPVVLSANSPEQITLIDGDAVLMADDGGFALSITKNPALQLDSAPVADASMTITSLWQHNFVGTRAARWINWARGLEGSVVWMATSY